MSSSKFIKGTILQDVYDNTIYIVTHSRVPVKIGDCIYIQVTEIKGNSPGYKWCYPESRGKKIGMSLDEAMVELL